MAFAQGNHEELERDREDPESADLSLGIGSNVNCHLTSLSLKFLTSNIKVVK
jgi:hypothetical protein